MCAFSSNYCILLAILALTVVQNSQSTSPTCPVETEYRDCSWNISCDDITGVRRCKEQSPCTSGCFCVNQTILVDGTCSDISSCSVCPNGTEYRDCGWNISCSHITGVRSCKEQSPCTSGCFCSDGTVLKDGVCSDRSSCPVCLNGTEYRDCSWNISCSDITGVKRCKEQSPCTSGCFCSDGTVLNNGVCSNMSICSDGSDNSGNSLDGTAIIVIGAMGGIIILLLIIPIVVCVVVLCVRKRDRKLKHPKVKDRMHHEIPPPPPTNINLICNNHVTQCNIQQSYSGNANPSHGVSTEEATVTTVFSATSDKNICQPSDNDTTGKYDYLHPHHSMPTNSTDDAMKDYMASVDQGNHLAQPSDKNGGYAVIRQRKCDHLDDEPTDGVDNPSDGSSHNAPTISLISSANLSIDGNGHKKYDSIKYGVVTLLRSDNQSL